MLLANFKIENLSVRIELKKIINIKYRKSVTNEKRVEISFKNKNSK